MKKSDVEKEKPQVCDVVYGLEQLFRWNEHPETILANRILSEPISKEVYERTEDALEHLCDTVNRTMFGYELLLERGESALEEKYPREEVYDAGYYFKDITLRAIDSRLELLARWVTLAPEKKNVKRT